MVKRTGFAKMGVIVLSVVMGLGLMGAGVSSWSDMVSIRGIIETGLIDTELDWIGSEVVPPTGGTGIGGFADEMTLHVTVTSAKPNVHYYSYFNIDNNTGFGTLPVDIAGYDIDGSYDGVVAEITGIVVGEQIDPGETIYGSELHIYLTDDTNQDVNLEFTVTVSVVLWNQ